MNVAAEVGAVVAHCKAISGLKRVYDSPPDALNQFPCAVVYATGASVGAPQGRTVCPVTMLTVVVEIHHSRQVLPQAVAAALVWPDLFMGQLLGTTTLDVQYPLTWRAGMLKYGAEDHYGIRFEVTLRG